MKKITTIRLGHYVLTIDEDAATEIANYLDAIKRRYATEESATEIIGDIEERIGELLQQKQNQQKRTYNTIEDVKEVISQMGPINSESTTEGQESKFSGPKRLYRDPENSIVAGVCGGVAAYFDIDPIIPRIGWVISVFLLGFGIPMYIILWIVIPEAKTTSEKLMMRGQKPTLQNIEDNLKTEFNNLSAKFNNPSTQNRIAGFLNSLFIPLGKIMQSITKIIFSIAMATLIFILITVLFSVTTNTIYLQSYHMILNGQAGLNTMLSAAGDPFWIKILFVVFLFLVISFFGLIAFSNSRNRDRIKLPRRYIGSAIIVAVLILFVLAFDGIRNVNHRTENAVYNENIQVTGDTLLLDVQNLNTEEYGLYTLNEFLEIVPSETGEWRIEQKNVNYGKNGFSGTKRAENTPRMYEIAPGHITLKQGEKVTDIKNQGIRWVKYVLHVPKGKSIKTGSQFHFIENNLTPLNGPNHTFTMDSSGYMAPLVSANNRVNLEKSTEIISIAGYIDVQIIQSTSNFVELVSGPILGNRHWIQANGNQLEIKEDRNWSGTVDKPSYIKIYVNSLERVEVSNLSKVHMSKWQGTRMDIALSGACTFDGKLKLNTLKTSVEGASKCTLEGEVSQIEIEATGASVFDGSELQSEIAQVSGDGASLIQTWTTKRIEGDLDGASKLKLKGNPIQSEMDVDGASSIEKL